MINSNFYTPINYDKMNVDDWSSMDFEVNDIDFQLITMIDFESSEPDWLSTMMDFETYIPDWQVPTIMKFEPEQSVYKFTINSLIDDDNYNTALESSAKSSKDDFAAGTTEEPLTNCHHDNTELASSTKSSTDVERVESDSEKPDGLKTTKDDAVAGRTKEELVHSDQDAVELSCDLFHVDAMLKIHFLLSSICLFYTFTNSLLLFFDENQPQGLDLLSSHEELNSIVCKETKLNIVSSPQEPIVETIPVHRQDGAFRRRDTTSVGGMTDPDGIHQEVIKTRYGRVVRKPVVYTDLTFSRRQQTCAAALESITTTRYGRIIRKPVYYS